MRKADVKTGRSFVTHVVGLLRAEVESLSIPMVDDLLCAALVEPAKALSQYRPSSPESRLESAYGVLNAWVSWTDSDWDQLPPVAFCFVCLTHDELENLARPLRSASDSGSVRPSSMCRIARDIVAKGSPDAVSRAVASMLREGADPTWRDVQRGLTAGARLVKATDAVQRMTWKLVDDGMDVGEALAAARLLATQRG